MAAVASGTREGSSPTRWGDREGRRRDILAAARAQLTEQGYLALNMREIARGAGVSPGTLYSYFATKDEIFATLYAEAIEAHNQRITPICEQAVDLSDLLAELATAYLDLYGTYGRSFTVWSVLHDDSTPGDHDLPVELLASLHRAALHQGELMMGGIRRVAASQGRTLVDEAFIMSFVWMTFTGIAENLSGERRRLSRGAPDDLIAHAARTIAAGITAPAC
jgi:AcrR family transcriptional regulator